MLCSSALSPPFPSLPSHPPTWPERECMCTCMCMCLFSLRSVDYVMECAGYIAACVYSLIHALDIWSKTCGLSPRVLTLSAERCPSWVRRFVCPCLCLLALLGGVRLCVRLCQRTVYVLEHV